MEKGYKRGLHSPGGITHQLIQHRSGPKFTSHTEQQQESNHKTFVMHSSFILNAILALGTASAASASVISPRANRKANEFTSGNW
jgi:hypothetical protein